MNVPQHRRITQEHDEFLVSVPCTARDLVDAVHVINRHIEAERPSLVGFDDAYEVQVRDDVIVFVLPAHYDGSVPL